MSAIIKKKDGKIEFKSETDLENFVFIHLDRLLNLSPISRQYRIGTEICDILAVDEQKRLTIIELKNAEDRYSGLQVGEVQLLFKAFLEIRFNI